jgi:hypothetical protein
MKPCKEILDRNKLPSIRMMFCNLQSEKLNDSFFSGCVPQDLQTMLSRVIYWRVNRQIQSKISSILTFSDIYDTAPSNNLER